MGKDHSKADECKTWAKIDGEERNHDSNSEDETTCRTVSVGLLS
jgi:hypothetical protein